MATSMGDQVGTSPSLEGEASPIVDEVDPIVNELRFEDDNEEIKHGEAYTLSFIQYLRNIWNVNRDHKRDEGITDQMLKNQRARDAEYDPEVEQLIKMQGFPVIYAGITGVKCRSAESWIMDVFNSRERTWRLSPTPDPEYARTVQEQVALEVMESVQEQLAEAGEGEVDPKDIAEAASKEADRILEIELAARTLKMETKIRDQFYHGGMNKAFSSYVADLVTLKAGILKGPITRIRRTKKWVTNPETDENVQEVKEEAISEYESVSPHDLYPSPNSTSPNDGSLVEEIHTPRRELADMIGQPGWDEAAIKRVLERFTEIRGMIHNEDESEEARETHEKRDFDDGASFAEDLDGLEFYTYAQGKMLKEAGITKTPKGDPIDDLAEYDINAILMGDELVFVSFNDDPTGVRPYYVCGWEKENGSFWYKGVPELMSDLQRMCNASVRSLAYNMGIASGPQIEVDMARMMPGEEVETIVPHRIWQTKGGNNSSPAIRFTNIDSKATELMAVYDKFESLADTYTQVPAYQYGNERTAGAGKTFGGLTALMNNASKGIKRVLLAIFEETLYPLIRRQFDWNMQYLPDDYKGDVEIEPKGIVALLVKEQLAERRIQFLQSTGNEIDMSIIGKLGRAKALRETAETLEMYELIPADDELRDVEEVEAQQAAQAAQLEQQARALELAKVQGELQVMQLDAQVKQAELQIKAAELELKQQQLQLKAQYDGVTLEQKGRKVEAEANKDDAVALDIGVKHMLDAAKRSGDDSDLSGGETDGNS